jgi:putative ABC transport system permease protein
MLRNLQYSLRSFRNQKLFTIVNLTGLTIGIIAASFILLYISYELSFDRFHKNSDRIFRVYSTFNSFTKEGVTEKWVQTPAPLANFLQDKFPEIEKTVRITRISKGLISSDEQNFFEDRMILADSSIFEVFTYPLIAGSPKQVLAQPNSVVLTESTAKKYFGKSDPLGKTIRYNRTIELTVTGIMKDIPDNTHLQFNMVTSMPSAKTFFGDDFLRNRMNTVAFTYILTNSNINFDKLSQSISQSTREYDGGDFGNNKLYHIQQLKSIHLHSNMGGELMPNNDIKTIYILTSIAILILIVACINYINLSLSINNQRSKELGIRKIMGAKKRQLISMYLTDASVFVGISVILSTFFITDFEQWFNRLIGVTVSDNFSGSSLIAGLAILFLIITTITGLASGWISSNISPMDTIKKPIGQTKRYIGTQDFLVLFQFVISIVLIASTLFINRQLKFTQNLNLGFSKDQLMIIPINDNIIRSKLLPLKQELTVNPNILSVTETSDIPGQMIWVTSINYDGQTEQSPSTMTYLEIDKKFIDTYEVQLKEGYMPGDTTCPYSGTHYLLNESAVKKLGWADPVGKRLSCYHGKDGFVTGIIGDFHFKSLHEQIEPLFLYIREGNSKYLSVKLNTFKISESIEFIHKLWNEIAPDSPFDYFFYDTFYDQLYKKESSFGRIMFIFSTIAILIACMGLFALAAFSSENRTKEIGIRKVNGATITEIVTMLIKEFLKWVSIAFIIATPIAWYAMHKWLQTFAYKTELSWWTFCLAGIIALTIAVFTVSWQSLKASIKNPVESLRYE